MLKEITNFVESMVQGALTSNNDSNDTEELDDKDGKNNGVTANDQMIAVKQYFRELQADQVEQANDDEEVAATDAGGHVKVKYATMKPLKDIDEERYHSGKVILSGILWKQGRRVNIWKERYFTLRETGLSYYSDPKAGNDIVADINKKAEAEAEKSAEDQKEEDGDEDKKKTYRSRGNMFFADIVTPTGHVVEDLRLMKKSALGGRKNCFCVQTEGNIYILCANSPEEKKVWMYNIDTAYSKFLKEQIRKVALMELAWEWGEELAKREDQEETEEEPEPTMMRRVMKSTLEKTKARFVSEVAKNKEKIDAVIPEKLKVKKKNTKKKTKKRTKKNTKKETDKEVSKRTGGRRRGELPKQLRPNDKKELRESFGRLTKVDRRRISAQRVGNIKMEALEGLTQTYEERVTDRYKKYVKQQTFARWNTFVLYKKMLRESAE